MSNGSVSHNLSKEDMVAKLRETEKRLEKLANSDQLDNQSEIGVSRSEFPNLKYAKPKYQNVESLLNYIEQDEDKGGIKLVIMNFND